MKKKVVVVLGLALFGVLFMYIVYYGFSFTFPPCIYTEKDIPLPLELQGTTLRVDGRQATSVLEGGDAEGLSCSKSLGSIGRSIVNGPDTAADYVQYYGAKEAGSIRGMQFTVKRMVESTKHGISTIDSGPGPLLWLILSDDQGKEYRLAAVYLGLRAEDSFLSVWKDGVKKGTLGFDVHTGGIEVRAELKE